MSFSTNSKLPSAWPLEKLDLEVVANLFGCSQAEARGHRARLAAHHADDAWLDRTLSALPVPSLCVAAALAAHGGMLHLPELDAHARTFDLDQGEIDAGVHDLIQLLLVAPLQSPRGRCLALVDSAADRLAARVTGLELVPLPRESFVADARADGGRALIAAAMALATAELRLTNAGSLHRTGIKKLAKQLDHDPDRLEHLIYAGLELCLVHVGDDDLLSPARDHLLAAAEGRYPHLAGLETLAALMSDGTPVALDAIDSYAEASMYRGSSTVRSDLLGLLPGFTAGTANGRAALVAVAPSGSPSASVTPSFEVFIPPESHPRDLIGILDACELVRIDRAIVARITKASVTRAVGRGATGDHIVEALAAATRTAIPQNVAAAIRDWAGSSVVATVDHGTVVVVPPAEQARVVAALPRARVVAPGVLVVPEEVTARAVTSALRKLGILDRSPEPTGPPAPVRARSRPAPVPATAANLRARLAAFQRNDPHERGLVKRVVRERIAEPVAQSTSAVEALAHRLERWEGMTSELLPLDGFDALVTLLEQLSTVDRQFVFAARGRKDLASRLNALLARPGLGNLDEDLLLDLETVFGVTKPRPSSNTALDWYSDHLFERLQAAAHTHSTVVLDLGTRRVTMAVSRVAPKGSTLLVFGEDEHDVNHAIRLTDIRALADAPRPSPSGAVPWQPAAGMKPPAGHVRCPCDSGRRYRDCCRGPEAPS